MAKFCSECGARLGAEGVCPASDCVARRSAPESPETTEARAAMYSAILEGQAAYGWQANPTGLSGRVVRGYKHWRYKR
jgi:hypothetical protein